MHEFDKCIITNKNGSELCNGTVKEFVKSVMQIALPQDIFLAPGVDVVVYIFNRVKGECVYRGKVSNMGDKTLNIANVEFVRSTQKRNNTRVDKTLHYIITHKYKSSSSNEKEALKEPIEITILNISATGMFFASTANFALGQRIPFVFKEAGSPIYLELKIMRVDKRVRGNNYGCMFVDIKKKDADNIFRYVLHEQILQRRRKLIFQ